MLVRLIEGWVVEVAHRRSLTPVIQGALQRVLIFDSHLATHAIRYLGS